MIGFESNAMLLKELAELEQKQSELALDYSNNLLQHISSTDSGKVSALYLPTFKKKATF